jgi:DNA modification methylase
MNSKAAEEDRDGLRTCLPAITYRSIDLLKPDRGNPRKHTKKQITRIARSIQRFRFSVPILVDTDLKVIAGHGRLLAARQLGLSEVPTISLDHLTPAQAKAFAIAENRLAELSSWDDDLLSDRLSELSRLDLDFRLDLTGFELGQIELLIDDAAPQADPADKLPREPSGPPVSRSGDLWELGPHRIYHGSSSDEDDYRVLMGDERAAMVFSTLPYVGSGDVHEPVLDTFETAATYEAAIADGLAQVCRLLARHSCEGSLHYLCTGWPHLSAVMMAAVRVYSGLKDFCVWTKDQADTGSLYRSQHEIILVLQHGRQPHRNYDGNKEHRRSNVWRYPAPSRRRGQDDDPRKPVRLVADALVDGSATGEIVLDPFLGTGTTLIAAERTKRVCRGLANDPRSVDAAIRWWQAFTGKDARHVATGRSFSDKAAL